MVVLAVDGDFNRLVAAARAEGRMAGKAVGEGIRGSGIGVVVEAFPMLSDNLLYCSLLFFGGDLQPS